MSIPMLVFILSSHLLADAHIDGTEAADTYQTLCETLFRRACARPMMGLRTERALPRTRVAIRLVIVSGK